MKFYVSPTSVATLFFTLWVTSRKSAREASTSSLCLTTGSPGSLRGVPPEHFSISSNAVHRSGNINYGMKATQVLGLVVAVLVSAWASYSFIRASITGAPPLYSQGWLQRILHFTAGLIFGALAFAACLKLAGR